MNPRPSPTAADPGGSTPSTPRPSVARVSTILVVEDEEPVRSLLTELLGGEGFRVFEASDGQAGLELAREHVPDLVISDVEMSGLTGHAMLQALQTDPATATIPFIFLTGRANRDDVRFGMTLGADDYITKPFDLNEILAAVRSRLARRQAIKNRFDEKLDSLRRNLLSSLPHELRTPLTGILGYAAILLEHPDQISREELIMAAQAIRTSGERLHRLVENFLLDAELWTTPGQGGELALVAGRVEPADLRACASDVLTARAKLHNREHDARLRLPASLAAITEPHLTKALDEIVDNAFRYSPSGTPIEIVSEQLGDQVRLSVVDYGRGFTPEQIRDVGAFVQFDRRRHEQQGLGLGLAIALRLAERYAGALEIESTPGTRTVVTLVLPAMTAAASDSGEPFRLKAA